MTHATAVLIAAYNSETTLERAVMSALAQPETAEVCIVDDASSDRTLAVAADLVVRDGRVSVIRLDRNGGPAAARNAAIEVTRSPWIAILDADDYWLPGRLATLHAATDQCDFIADALMRVPETADAPPSPRAAFTPQPMSFEHFVLGNLGALKGPLDLGFLKPIFRRSFIDTHAIRYRPEMRLGEDYEFYARALGLGALFLVGGHAGYISVERRGSLSKAHSEIDLERLRDCDPDLARIALLSSRDRRALRRHWSSVDCRLQWRRLITAVKQRDAVSAMATFHTPQAAVYLATRLGEQAWVRSAAFRRRAAG